MMDEESWMTAAQAKAYGFIEDEVMSGDSERRSSRKAEGTEGKRTLTQ